MLWWHLSHEQHFFFYLAMAALLALVLYLIFRVGYKWCGCDKTSDADVDADSLLYQAPSSVTFVPVTQYSEVRKDRGSGADQDVSVWKAVVPAGCHSLGMTSVKSYETPKHATLVVHAGGRDVVPPIRYPPLGCQRSAWGGHCGYPDFFKLFQI